MAVLTWNAAGTRHYETGVSKGVLYPKTASSGTAYGTGVAWNGLTAITESPSGAEANPLYADNIKYLNLFSAEEFGGTIEAYTYPDAFAVCDGSVEPTGHAGLFIAQQGRASFGLCYRTELGNDASSTHGYKLHLIYGASVSPSEKAFSTINDSPEAITFSWEFTTIPELVSGYLPTSLLVIDSTKVEKADLDDLEELLYGTASTAPSLPLPDAVVTLIAAT